jgi:hypothetical protein
MSTVETNDGVAVMVDGDLVLSLWHSSARVHRTRWFFDVVDEAAPRNPDGILILLLILPSSSPPDAPTRAENDARLRKLGRTIRRVVTVPTGDALFHSVVRTVMRAMFLIQGKSDIQVVESSPRDGIARLLEASSSATPPRSQIERNVKALYKALGLPAPFDPEAPADAANG